MGASRRRIDRRLSRPVAPLPPLASLSRPWLLSLLSLICAGALALALLSADQLAQYMPGPWFELLGVSVLILASLAVVGAVRRAWRRRREGLIRRGALWAGGAAVAFLVGLVAVVGLIENAQIASVISGADVRLTKPVIESLPRPPGTKLLDERPGLADTESISQDISATELNSIVPFYERELTKLGWVEDKTSAGTRIVRFTKGDLVLSVAIDPPSSGYTLIVDRLPQTPTASPGSSPSGP